MLFDRTFAAENSNAAATPENRDLKKWKFSFCEKIIVCPQVLAKSQSLHR